MDKSNLDKIIKIIKKTGDKIIVLNEGDPCLVMMSFKEYEKLVFNKNGFKALTNGELTDRINKEIAFYKEEQEDKKIGNIVFNLDSEIKTEEAEVKNIENSEHEAEQVVNQDYEVEPIK